MHLFISEYLCSGAWPGELTGSLAQEGRAMLSALLHDASQIDGLQTITTWDKRLGPPPSGIGEFYLPQNPADERKLFEELATGCDATFLIAPEFMNILAERAKFVEAHGNLLISSSAAAIELCADKLTLAQHLQSVGIPTIPTQRFQPETLSECVSQFPCVIKPRFGAGSQETFLVSDQKVFMQIIEQRPADSLLGDAVLQPYLSGTPISVAVILDSDGVCRDLFPPADQVLSDDGRFVYLGGRVPSVTAQHAALQQVAKRALSLGPWFAELCWRRFDCPRQTAASTSRGRDQSPPHHKLPRLPAVDRGQSRPTTVVPGSRQRPDSLAP